jgi:RHS repeat-associated protein
VAGSTTTQYVYGLGGLLYGEYTNTGTVVREYIYLNGEPLAQISKSGTTDVLTYLHTDHLGTPRFGTNTSGTQVWAWAGDAFGVGTPTGSMTVNLRMPGQYFDTETGLFYNWNRYYSPAIGRYISSDPIGLDGGMNTFNYANASPVMYYDPEGLWDTSDFGPPIVTPTPEEWAAGAEVVKDILWDETARKCFAESDLTACAITGVGLCGGKIFKAAGESYDIYKKWKVAKTLGDLTPEEIKKIQKAVDSAGRPIDVVGSAARGKRKAGSDIDYTTAPSSKPYFDEKDLPDLDRHGILDGAPEKGKPSIRFEPNSKPKKVEN